MTQLKKCTRCILMRNFILAFSLIRALLLFKTQASLFSYTRESAHSHQNTSQTNRWFEKSNQ